MIYLNSESRPDWLHYKSRYGINEILFNYRTEKSAQDFLMTGLLYGHKYENNSEKVYKPGVMILDTHLSDKSDKMLFQEINKYKTSFSGLHILMANPFGYFANQRHEKLQSATKNSPIDKTLEGLVNIIQYFDIDFNINKFLEQRREDNQEIKCKELINKIRNLGSNQLELKFYDEYPSSPMYFFNDILMLGRFGATRNCMEMAWYMIVDEQSCNGDLYDENRKEFYHIWENSKDFPEYPSNFVVNSAYIPTNCSSKNPEHNVKLEKHQQANSIQFDVAIICALPEEFDAIANMGKVEHNQLEWSDHKVAGVTKFFKKTKLTTSKDLDIKIVATTLSQMGSIVSASVTSTILHNFRPKVILLVGLSCGMPSEERQIGDLLIANKIIYYSSGKVERIDNEKVSKNDPKIIQIEEQLEEKLNSLKTDVSECQYLDEIRRNWVGDMNRRSSLNIHIGPLGTTDQVIADQVTRDEVLKDHRKIIGLEMEGFGVYYAASSVLSKKPYYLLLKSISDRGDEKKQDSDRNYAAYVAAEYCYHILKEHYETLFLA